MDKHTPSKNAGKSPSVDPLLVDLYNALMGDIEPELTTDVIPVLDTIYANESEEDRSERAIWYASCFDLLEERMSMFLYLWKKELKGLKRTLERIAMGESGGDEEKLTDIERSISET